MKDKISLSSKKSRIALILVLTLLLQIFMPIINVYAATKDLELNVEYTLGDEIKFSEDEAVYIKAGWQQESVYGTNTVTLEEENEYDVTLRIGDNTLRIDTDDYEEEIYDGKMLMGFMFTGGDGSNGNPYVIRLVYKEKESTWDGNGSGTADDPYLIENLADLNKLAINVNTEKMNYNGKYFKLTTNINTGDDNWTPIGNDKPFKGSFDGDGHTITYKITNGGNYVGLFAQIEDATIKNLNVAGSVEGTENVGGLVSDIRNTEIINCASSTDVKGENYVGGLVGSSDESNISYSVASGEINVTGFRNGGLVGTSFETTISNSVFNGKIIENSSDNEFDIIAGYNNHTLYDNIPNCYYLDTSKPNKGGIHGESKTAVELNAIALSVKEAGYGVYADALLTYVTVTFNTNGGNAIPSQEVYAGGKAAKPTDPTKSGFAFVNWYSDEELTTLFDFSSAINNDTTIYAKFNQLITSVSATITAPVGGEHPSFIVTVPDGAHYTAVVDTWYDLDNNGAHLSDSDTFVTGNEYQARIHFIANTGYEITNLATYTINDTPNTTTFDTAEQRGMNFVATAPAHTHTLTEVPATTPTCMATGNNAYYICSGCNKIFKDALGTVETTIGDETLPIDSNAHDWNDWVETTPATETAPGEETRTCKHNSAHTETQPIPQLSHTHILAEVPAKSATCCAIGNNTYYNCSGCTKVFKDALGTVETTIEDETLPIDSNAHDWNDWIETTPATVDTAGEKTRTCKHDATHTETDTIEKLALEITECGNKTYTLDSGAKVQIKCNGALSNFTKLTSNGTDVESSNYTKESGSTVITLKNAYLDSLSEGTYKLAFVYNDGRKVETNLTIAKANTTDDTTGDDTTTDTTNATDTTNTTNNTSNGITTGGETKTSNSPKTGDNIVIYIAIMLVSILGVAGTIKFIKKKD